MHNNIMAAGFSKDRHLMLGPRKDNSQWAFRVFYATLTLKEKKKSEMVEYLKKCIFEGPYMLTNVLIAAVEAAENILPVAAHEEAETIHNMTAENRLYFQAEKEASNEKWTAIERTQRQRDRQTVTPQSDPFREDIDPEQARRDKDKKKNLALLLRIQEAVTQPTNNNLSNFYPTPGTRLEYTTPGSNIHNHVRAFWESKDDDSCWG
ncbi:hypothetical protein Tco_1201059 [Tanacetum coccineum]